MSYVSTSMSSDRKNVFVWERNKKGKRRLKRYPCEYYFYVRDDDGTYEDIYGNKVKRLDFRTYSQMKETRMSLQHQNKQIYESDIPMEYKILSNHYYGKPILPLNFTLYDIEVDYHPEKGFSSTENPYAPVNAVALYHKHTGRMVVYAVPSEKFKDVTIEDIPKDITDNVDVVLCKNEAQLLQHFLTEIEDTDIFSGWNSDFFDAPYIYERLKIVFGKATADKLSLPGAVPPKYREVEKYGNINKLLVTSGRLSVDYLELFKKFEMAERPSYSLEAISEEIMPELPKLEYDGTLYQLYNDDFFEFLRYNARDTEVLKGFEDKLGYMQLAIDMSHLSGANVGDVLGTIKVAEQAIINYCHYDLGKIVPDSDPYKTSEGKFTGALVLKPQVGMHDWISSIDIASLYPSAIRSLNISPETIVGQFLEREKAHEWIEHDSSMPVMLHYENGEAEELPAEQWKKVLKDNNWVVSGYGTVFSLKTQGLIPSILENWYNGRKEYKKKMFDAKNKILETNSESEKKKLKEEADYCDRIQYIKKIQLNSMYGALGNQYFKFFDIRMAESTTRTSRGILMHMVRKVAELLDGDYTWPSDSTIYSDTDSVYFKTHADDMEEAGQVARAVEIKVNKSFPKFMKRSFLCNDDYNKLITAEQEIISDKGIFVKPKHYMLHLVKDDGYDVDKMKIMGLPLKKTTVPKPIKVVLTEFMEQLLKGRPWDEISHELVDYRHNLKNADNILEIGLPKGVKKVEEYTQKYIDKEPDLRLPGHVAASIFWNHCLEHYDDKESFQIVSGTKIKVFYLTKKFGKFKSIAIPTDTRKVPDWFVENFQPLIDREAQAQRLIENTIKTILAAIDVKMPTRKSLLFDELVEY